MGVKYSISHAGEKYNRVTTIEYRGRDSKRKQLWLCKCDCGTLFVTRLANLKSGNTKSCGCLFVSHINTEYIVTDLAMLLGIDKRTVIKRLKHGETSALVYADVDIEDGD